MSVVARQQRFICLIVSIETHHNNLITAFLIILQTNNNINDMEGVVDPYIIVDQCLDWIGFGILNQRVSISTEADFNSLNNLNDIEEKNIWDMANSFHKWTRKKYNAVLHLGSHVRPPVACAHAIGESS